MKNAFTCTTFDKKGFGSAKQKNQQAVFLQLHSPCTTFDKKGFGSAKQKISKLFFCNCTHLALSLHNVGGGLRH